MKDQVLFAWTLSSLLGYALQCSIQKNVTIILDQGALDWLYQVREPKVSESGRKQVCELPKNYLVNQNVWILRTWSNFRASPHCEFTVRNMDGQEICRFEIGKN